jgi:hypothetical protein
VDHRDEPHRHQRRGAALAQVVLGAVEAFRADPAAQPGAAQPLAEDAAHRVPADLPGQGARRAGQDRQGEAARAAQRGGQHDHGLAGDQQAQQERHLDGGGEVGEEQDRPPVEGGQPVDEQGRGVEQVCEHRSSLVDRARTGYRFIPRETPDPLWGSADAEGPGRDRPGPSVVGDGQAAGGNVLVA